LPLSSFIRPGLKNLCIRLTVSLLECRSQSRQRAPCTDGRPALKTL
jgi:hypothetical protein